MKAMMTSLVAAACLAGAASAQQVRAVWGTPCPPPACSKHVPACGYWTVQKQIVYVPGYWTWWQHPCGEFQRKWVPPSRRVAPVRVWVSYPIDAVCRR